LRGALSSSSDSTGQGIIKNELEQALTSYAAATKNGEQI